MEQQRMNGRRPGRHPLTEKEFARADQVLAEAGDRLGELTPFQREFTDSQTVRICRYEDKLWLSDKEIKIIEDIAARLGL